MRALEQLLGPLGAIWGGSWCLLGCSWEPLGVLLGGSWGLLGVSEADLEATKTSQRQHAKKRANSGPLNVESRPIFWGGLGGQNQPKMAPKTNQNLRRFSKAKKLLFKSVLEPSWADLGPQKHVPKPCVPWRAADLQKKACETICVSNLTQLGRPKGRK